MPALKRVYIDCTNTFDSGLQTGIQRVVRNYVSCGTRLAPVVAVDCIPIIFRSRTIVGIRGLDDLAHRQHRYALRVYLNRAYLASVRWLASVVPSASVRRILLAHPSELGLARLLYSPISAWGWLRSRWRVARSANAGVGVSISGGDILFLADAAWPTDMHGCFDRVKESNGKVVFLIYDLIPLTHPSFYYPAFVARFREWFLGVINVADFLICISRFTQESLIAYLSVTGSKIPPSAVVYLGCDFVSLGKDKIGHAGLRLALAQSSNSFLCVGTLEPRKNLQLVIDAFESIWSDGSTASLILIGRVGWLVDELLERIAQHPERNRRLFWFNDVNDADLNGAYAQARCLIFPSLVEGFGLPIVEALSRGLPVIASDIPVFREIGEGNVRYFPPENAQGLATAIKAEIAAPRGRGSDEYRWLSWEESTDRKSVV